MLVYAVIDYSYFALAMTYDLQIKNLGKYTVGLLASLGKIQVPCGFWFLTILHIAVLPPELP